MHAAQTTTQQTHRLQPPPTALRVSREHHPDDTLITVKSVRIGGGAFTIIAGPCAIEDRAQLLDTAHLVQQAGAGILRGGAYKPRSSPYSFQGLEAEGLALLAEARRQTGMPVITEVIDPACVDLVARHADILQVGSRNCQNFALLKTLGRANRPVLLKRGYMNTIDELLMSAEYILAGGNDRVILCERGIRTFETATRNTLDISAVPVLKEKTHLPVIVDPSHACGHARYVPALARAALAAGADGIMVEVHADPSRALCDGAQSLSPETFADLSALLLQQAAALGRQVTATPDQVTGAGSKEPL